MDERVLDTTRVMRNGGCLDLPMDERCYLLWGPGDRLPPRVPNRRNRRKVCFVDGVPFASR